MWVSIDDVKDFTHESFDALLSELRNYIDLRIDGQIIWCHRDDVRIAMRIIRDYSISVYERPYEKKLRQLKYDVNSDVVLKIESRIPLGLIMGHLRSMGIDVSGTHKLRVSGMNDGDDDTIYRDIYFLRVAKDVADRVKSEIRKYCICRGHGDELLIVNVFP